MRRPVEGGADHILIQYCFFFLFPYSDVFVVPMMKKYIYCSLGCDDTFIAMDAGLNIMQAVYICLQTSQSSQLDEDILSKAEHIFQSLLNGHFTERVTVSNQY